VRFGLLDRQEIAQVRAVSRQLGDQLVLQPRLPDGLPGEGSGFAGLRGALYALRFPPLYFNSLVKGGVFLRWGRNQAAFEATLASRGHYHFGTADGSSVVAVEGSLPGFTPSPVLAWHFDRMLARLDAAGIEADFVAMPINQATARAMHPALRDGFAAWLAGYAARYRRFHVVTDTAPAWDDRYFGDGFSHLNPRGAALFSAWLGACLELRFAGQGCAPARDQPRLQAAPPSTQNEAQWGWLSATGRAASARVRPSSKRGS
jgi:hypothetical protein